MNSRHCGIELLRIVSMFMILLLHANYWTFGAPSVNDIHDQTAISVGRVFLEELCIVAVNVFVIISGWFGIKASIKGFVSLFVQVFFYAFILQTIGVIFRHDSFAFRSYLDVFVVGRQYWFIVSYFLLYIFSPVLNAFVKCADKKVFASFLLVFFTFEFIYGWHGGVENFGCGYSALSFFGLYLLSRYINLYCENKSSKSPTCYFLFYLFLSLFTTLIVCMSLWFYHNNTGKYISYNCPLVIASSISLFLFFKNIKIDNKKIGYFSSSALSVYLIHQHPIAWDLYRNTFIFLNDKFCVCLFVLIVFLLLVIFFIACVLIDKVRIFITPMSYIVNKSTSLYNNLCKRL